MKLLLLVFSFLFFSYSFAQSLKIIVVDTSSNIHDFPVTLDLVRDSVKVASTIYNGGEFLFRNIPPGTYKIFLSRTGNKTEVKEDFVIDTEQKLELVIKYPGPCLYNYPKNNQVRCPENHADHIIPIVYGKPAKKLFLLAEKGKVHLGGCLLSGCDPKFYCTIHKIEF